MMASRSADAEVRRGRWDKTLQFAEAAALLFDDQSESSDVGDSFITLAVHAGIAASDVICIARLGKYSASGAHDEAIALLKSADPDASKHLSRLLSLKTKAGYTHRPASLADVRTAHRSHRAILAAAEMM